MKSFAVGAAVVGAAESKSRSCDAHTASPFQNESAERGALEVRGRGSRRASSGPGIGTKESLRIALNDEQ